MEYSYNKFLCKITVSLRFVSVLNYIAVSEYRQYLSSYCCGSVSALMLVFNLL